MNFLKSSLIFIFYHSFYEMYMRLVKKIRPLFCRKRTAVNDFLSDFPQKNAPSIPTERIDPRKTGYTIV